MDTTANSIISKKVVSDRQNERLQSKHIQTLSFVQELADENQLLKVKVEELESEQKQCEKFHSLADESKARMKELQHQYLQKADEIMADLSEKHNVEMVKVIGEKLDQEKYYLEEMVMMRDEIDELDKMNKVLISKNKDLDEADDQLPIALSKVKHYETEIERSHEENNRLQVELDDKMGQLHDLLIFQTNHENINHDLQEARQKTSEYQYRVIRLEKELKDASKDNEEGDLVEQLKLKLEKVLKERELRSDEATSASDVVHSLKAEIEQFRKQLVATQTEKEIIAMQHHNVLSELQQLKKQLLRSKDNSNFKDFVSLKRELNNLRYENEDLRAHILATRTISSSLPSMKADGDKMRKSQSKPNSATSQKPNTHLQSISFH